MRIGFFTETYLPSLNGVSLSLKFARDRLEKKGHEIFVFAPKVAGYKDRSDRVIRLNSVKVFAAEPVQKIVLPFPNQTFRRVWREKLDLVHAHGGGFFSFLGYQLAMAKGYPLVFTYHTYIERYKHYFFFKGKIVTPRMVRTWSRTICNYADVIIAPTEKMKKVLESYGVTKKIAVVPNPMDFSQFVPGEKGYLRKKFNLPEDNQILLTVGRLGIEKNLEFLLQAFQIVAQKEKNALLILVGDGPEKENLEKLAIKLGIAKQVLFPGFIPSSDMGAVYSDADVFVFSSTSETQGLVVPEAAACGLPVVVVKDDAFVGAVEDGVNGFATRERPKDFAEKVLQLLANENLRNEFGKNSVKLIKENFDQEKIIEKLVSVYREAIEIRSAKPRWSLRVQNQVKSTFSLFGLASKIRNWNHKVD